MADMILIYYDDPARLALRKLKRDRCPHDSGTNDHYVRRSWQRIGISTIHAAFRWSPFFQSRNA